MISIEYKDISLTAKDNSTPTCIDKQDFSNLLLLKQDNVVFKKIATLENMFWLLDNSFENFPDILTNENFALWSQSMSDEKGEFTNPIELELNFSDYESCVGLAFEFLADTDDYCNLVNIKWYQDETLLSENDYELDSNNLFCMNSVLNFNKILISFKSMSKPYRYLKLQNITYGVIRVFEDDELRKINLLEDISLTSEELRINTLDFTLNNKKLIDFIFQKKQPLTLRRNNELIGTFFIENSKRRSATLYEISAVDYLGVLEKMIFNGSTYTNANVSDIVADIMGNIPYEIATDIGDNVLSGTLDKCTCREALLQVAFACCAIVDTTRNNKVVICSRNTTVKAHIEEGIYTGGNFSKEDEITEVRLKLNNDTYLTKKNPILSSDALDNIIEFSGVFVDNSNAESILNYLYEYYVTNKNDSANLKFIVNNNEKVGDVITYVTEYLGIKKGQITQMKFNFNSNKLVAQAELKDLEVI